MEIHNILTKILYECGKKNIDFLLQKEGDVNEIVFDEKLRVLTVNLPDTNDGDLFNKLINCLELIKSTT